MKVVILAGGLPSNLIEEDEKIPKPMAEIGGRPILWHIMKQYSHYGYKDFIICAGYKCELIKNYFMNFYIYQSDITIDLQTNDITIHRKQTEDWRVTVIDTGLHSSITERIHMIKNHLNDEPFIITYGDCVSDISIQSMVQAHQQAGKTATLAVSRPAGRNEILDLQPLKSLSADAWVNACSMIVTQDIFRYLSACNDFFGKEMLSILTDNNALYLYKHDGFWQPMETVRDKHMLELMWKQKSASWVVWED